MLSVKAANVTHTKAYVGTLKQSAPVMETLALALWSGGAWYVVQAWTSVAGKMDNNGRRQNIFSNLSPHGTQKADAMPVTCSFGESASKEPGCSWESAAACCPSQRWRGFRKESASFSTSVKGTEVHKFRALHQRIRNKLQEEVTKRDTWKFLSSAHWLSSMGEGKIRLFTSHPSLLFEMTSRELPWP